ncbi:MAG: hypothetical protein V7K64_15650 [Nostoc sp.]|uniref:hypothetical protein n=1 Tax=Nostoc sp. TaxID=1180 RepID=UPI002FF64361
MRELINSAGQTYKSINFGTVKQQLYGFACDFARLILTKEAGEIWHSAFFTFLQQK